MAVCSGVLVGSYCIMIRRSEASVRHLAANSRRYSMDRSREYDPAYVEEFTGRIRSILLIGIGIGFGAVLIVVGVAALIAAE